jgi:hypothetical protein
MKILRCAILFVAACAQFTWVTAQNTLKNSAQNINQADKTEAPKAPPSLAQPANLAQGNQAEQCIPANTFTQLPAAIAGTQTDAYGVTRVALGSYERISPDGRFILRSFSGGRLGEVSLIELDAAGQAVAAYDTPLSNEAFPVQGTWRYLVDVNGDHYTFSSILRSNSQSKTRTKPVFRGGMRGFYAAASELPSSATDKPGHVRIRSMSWPNPSNSEVQGEGALMARTLEIDTAAQRIVADSGSAFLCRDRIAQDGPMYALPMISVNGLEFAALPQTPVQGEQTMRIFGFGPSGTGCEPRATFNFSSGKTIFGFAPSTPAASGTPAANSTSAADVAYEYRSQVWWVHRSANGGAGQRFNIAPYYSNPRTLLRASTFPGITRDGRVIYGATLKDCPANAGRPCVDKVGYVTTDPFQSNAYQQFLQSSGTSTAASLRKQCITHGDIARERAAFAKLHNLTAN